MFRKTILLCTSNTIARDYIIARNLSQNVGFIGLGNMGGHMANNLITKGRTVSVFDVSEQASKAVKKGDVCKSAADVAKKCPVLFTMLPNNDIVLNTYLSSGGLLDSAAKDTLMVDSSTVDPNVAKTIHEAANKKGIRFIDAPVSGGVVGAEAATLTFMVGGPKDSFERSKEYLLQMGAKAVHCGQIGAGQVAKICNNMLLAITMIGTSETMNLGMRMGLDGKMLMDILNTSTGRCWSSEVYNPVPGLVPNVPPSNEYKGGFAAKLMTKDLGLAQNIATESSTPIPLGSLAHQLFRTVLAKGMADKDFAIVYQFLKDNAAA